MSGWNSAGDQTGQNEYLTAGRLYRWSSYLAHGGGEPNEWLDPLVTFERLSPKAAVRRRKWSEKVHEPLPESTLAAIQRSNATGLPYGNPAWVEKLAKKLDLDLTIRPRGRPRKFG